MLCNTSQNLEIIPQDQQQMKQLDEVDVPQVGIFWILPDGLLAFEVAL
jgi:hypothetical protein